MIDKAPFKITTLLTDNGKEFTDRFCAAGERQPTGSHAVDQVCADNHIEHPLTKPRTPQTNGMIERFNGRIADVLRTHRDSAASLQATLKRFVYLYNHYITQKNLRHKTPLQTLQHWYAQQPQLFIKIPRNHTGPDTAVIPWEVFRPQLKPVHEKERKSNAGRKPFEVVLMFKILILQTLYNLADEQVEYQIRDRLSFARFLGLGLEDEVPDATTVWRFRERLKELGLLEAVFNRFDDFLVAEGFEAKQGQIIDASIVPVPIQRNSREANRRIKNGEVPQEWGDAKRAQKDVDGRWTGKRGKKYFGYKNHLSIDAKHKLIRRFETTPANVHDSRVFDDLIDPDNVDPGVWADSAYRSQETEKVLQDAGYESHLCEKGQRNQPPNNRTRAKIRSRVEHVFGFHRM